MQEIFDELFHPVVMKFLSSDHHKTSDGNFSYEYNYYTDNHFLSHDGYVRHRGGYEGIRATGSTFSEAKAGFLKFVREANIDVILHYYQEEKGFTMKDTEQLDGMTYSEMIDFIDSLIEGDDVASEATKEDTKATENYKKLLAGIKEIIEKSGFVGEFEEDEDEDEDDVIEEKGLEEKKPLEDSKLDFVGSYKYKGKKIPFYKFSNDPDSLSFFLYADLPDNIQKEMYGQTGYAVKVSGQTTMGCYHHDVIRAFEGRPSLD